MIWLSKPMIQVKITDSKQNKLESEVFIPDKDFYITIKKPTKDMWCVEISDISKETIMSLILSSEKPKTRKEV